MMPETKDVLEDGSVCTETTPLIPTLTIIEKTGCCTKYKKWICNEDLLFGILLICGIGATVYISLYK